MKPQVPPGQTTNSELENDSLDKGKVNFTARFSPVVSQVVEQESRRLNLSKTRYVEAAVLAYAAKTPLGAELIVKLGEQSLEYAPILQAFRTLGAMQGESVSAERHVMVCGSGNSPLVETHMKENDKSEESPSQMTIRRFNGLLTKMAQERADRASMGKRVEELLTVIKPLGFEMLTPFEDSADDMVEFQRVFENFCEGERFEILAIGLDNFAVSASVEHLMSSYDKSWYTAFQERPEPQLEVALEFFERDRKTAPKSKASTA